jgi:DNA-binding IclR family transcriptional regulator
MAHERYEIAERVLPYLRRLAEESGDTAYFLLRRGDEAVCYGRAEGSFPIKTLTLKVGDRRPLGMGAGPMAILAFLDDAEVERLMRTQAAARKRFGISDESLRQMIATARASGHSAFGGQLIQGMAGVGVPVRDVEEKPVAGLSIAAIASRLEPLRRKQVVQSLRKMATLIQKECRHLL